MTSISLAESKLPPGFRFHPREDELVCDYLMNKIAMTGVGGKECYFYSHLDRKYAIGSRMNRAIASRYWKATGKNRAIARKGAPVGMKKTLVFPRERAPKGRKTDWVMHEFCVNGFLNHSKNLHFLKDEWVLCRVFHESRDVGPKPEIGGEPSALSPPPLMDPNLGSYPTCTSQYEQVPCFSISAIDQMDSPFTDTGLLQQRTLQNYANTYRGITDSGMSLDPCTEKVLSSVLSHHTRTESSPRFKDSDYLGEGISSHFV